MKQEHTPQSKARRRSYPWGLPGEGRPTGPPAAAAGEPDGRVNFMPNQEGTGKCEYPASDTSGSTLVLEHVFEDLVFRSLTKDGEPWFLAADACRALRLASHKGSYASHLDKLDDDEKHQVSREAVLAGTTTPGLNPDGLLAAALDHLGATPVRANDPLAIDKSPTTWIVSEGGLYTLILRSRDATTKGTQPHRFRRWVTGVVLPSVRKLYELGRDPDRAAGSDVDEELYLALSTPGRTIVTVLPDGKRHIHRTEYDAMLGEILATDCRLLSYALKTTEGFWHKAQQMRSVDRDLTGGFAIAKLESAILEGGRLAAHYLRCYNETSD